MSALSDPGQALLFVNPTRQEALPTGATYGSEHRALVNNTVRLAQVNRSKEAIGVCDEVDYRFRLAFRTSVARAGGQCALQVPQHPFDEPHSCGGGVESV